MNEGADLTGVGRIGLVGAGAVATALARALAARGARVGAVSARNPAHARALAAALSQPVAAMAPEDLAAAADLIFLAVPDDALPAVAAWEIWHAGHALVHLSGAHGAALLAPAAVRGARIGALHPLLTFPHAEREGPVAPLLRRFAGATWALEAEDAALNTALHAVVRALGGQVIELAADARVPYHLAAVLASNYVVALLAGSAALWQSFGGTAEAALPALLPLVRAAVDRLAEEGLPGSLSGPIARGDRGTVAAHMVWLEAHAADAPALADVRASYVALGRLALRLAVARGTLAPEAEAALRALLNSDGASGIVP